MDVQGSRYHLLNGRADWSRCVDEALEVPLAVPWQAELDGDPSGVRSALAFDDDLDVLRLHRDTPLFRRAGRTVQMDPATRRGAGRDGYGNWYWIGADRASIRWLPSGQRAAATWWSALEPPSTCSPGGAFAPCGPAAAPSVTLSGLTVTTRHYLLAGYVDGVESGLLVFDLQGGGEALRMVWPAGFRAVDLCDTADGGALVLDSEHSTYWRLDEYLRVRGAQSSTPALFQPAEGGAAEVVMGPILPSGTAIDSAAGCAVSIEPGPDGGVFVLDSDPARGYSLVSCYDDATGLRFEWSLADSVEVIDPEDPSDTPQLYSVFGHDFAYLAGDPSATPPVPPTLYVADGEGLQVIAYLLAEDGPVAQPDFLPLRRWAGRALVRSGPGLWYDFGERWIPVEVFTQCRFAPQGTIVTATDFADQPAGAPFDSQLPGCVWHRLLFDAQIPNGCSVTVRARANDDPSLLDTTPWLAQPVAYLRTGGSELPWADPWADRHDVGAPPPDGSGTYELLFQQVVGRYVQLEIGLVGNGRSSPLVRSVRAWYPRFSYPEHYLPDVYVENDAPDRFLERFLANMEGSLLGIEERIEHSHLLLDARTTLAEDLPWLACWFGLALDPLWSGEKCRFLIRNVDRFYRRRGTVAGLLAILRVYLDTVVSDAVFDTCSADAGGGVRLVERFLTRTVAPGDDERIVVAAAAHRFDVLVPADLGPSTLQMVQRIVETTKPAHTWFDVKAYFDLFVVGSARLGLDTELGHGAAFTALVTGRDTLAAGYLGYPRPFDIADRIVIDRDRVGDLPAL